jgi:membrane dipeptidase
MSQDAARVHDAATVLMAHLHLERAYTREAIEYVRPAEDLPDRQVDIPKLRRGGVKVIWLSEGGPGEFAVDPEAMQQGGRGPNLRPAIRTAYHGPSEVQRMLRGWDAVHRLCRDHPQDLELATTVRQARDIVARGKIAVFMHTELLLIANDLAVLRSYHAMGLRVTGLVHDALPDWIDSSLEQHEPGGLTDFGRQVIREMNRLGMVIDVSHASKKAVVDILQESRQPIVASHSMAQRLAPLPRNLSDEEIAGIAQGGGVIGVHFASGLCDVACLKGRTGGYGPQYSQHRLEMIGKVLVPGAIDPFQYEAAVHSNREGAPGSFFPRVGLDKLLEHVDYLVNLVGIDHVGVGSDLQYLEDVLIGLDTVAEMPNLTAALLDQGYTVEAVHKILGGNFLRVMEQVIGA